MYTTYRFDRNRGIEELSASNEADTIYITAIFIFMILCDVQTRSYLKYNIESRRTVRMLIVIDML